MGGGDVGDTGDGLIFTEHLQGRRQISSEPHGRAGRSDVV